MPTIVHFDVPADDIAGARKFYESLFGWQFSAPPGFEDFYLFETKTLDGEMGVGGGLGKRQGDQKITLYIGVDSIEDFTSKVAELGGTVIQPKLTVPGWGYMAICLDPEDNTFGLWQEDANATP